MGFIADTEHHSVRIIDIDNQICSTIAGDYKSKQGLITGPLDKTRLEEPRGICLDNKGNIIVSTKSAIVYLDLEKQVSSIIAGDFKQFGFKDGSLRSASLFDHPDGLVLDNSNSNGIIYVADTYNHKIRVLDLGSNKVTTLCGNGQAAHSDGQFNKVSFNFPQKVCLITKIAKKLLLVTELNDCVRCIDLIKKEVFTLCGGFQSKNGFKDGEGQEALLNFPYGIVQIESLKFAITESDNHSLRIMNVTDLENINNTNIPLQTQKFSQTTYQMLLSVAQASSQSITENVLDLVQSYSQSKDKQTKEALLLLAKCVCIALNMTDIQANQEITVLKHSNYLLQNIPKTEPQSITQPQLQQLRILIEDLNDYPEIKLPGIRSLFQWILDFEKVAQYINHRSSLDKSAMRLSSSTSSTPLDQVKFNPDKENDLYCKNQLEVFQLEENEGQQKESINLPQLIQENSPKSNNVKQQIKQAQTPKKQQKQQPIDKLISPIRGAPNQKQTASANVNNPTIKQVDQNKQQQLISPVTQKPKTAQQQSQGYSSSKDTVSKKQYEEVVKENKSLKNENEELKARIEKMKIEFMQMSNMMEEIINSQGGYQPQK